MDLSHIEQQQRKVDGGLRTAGSDKYNQPQQQYIAMGVSHTNGAWAASLCRCALFMLSVVGLVYVWGVRA